jgi:hypothetical protein
LNVVEVLKSDRQWGHQNTINVVSQPRFLNLISRSSFWQEGHSGHSSSLASVKFTFAVIIFSG